MVKMKLIDWTSKWKNEVNQRATSEVLFLFERRITFILLTDE